MTIHEAIKQCHEKKSKGIRRTSTKQKYPKTQINIYDQIPPDQHAATDWEVYTK